MDYSRFVDVYELLGKTSGRLEKVRILAEFMRELKKDGKSEWAYLLFGRVVPDYDPREFGISRQIAFKAIASALGVKEERVISEFNKIGDVGDIAERFLEKKQQSTLFSKKLTVGKVFDKLRKIMEINGKGAIEKKILLISELLGSARGKEAKYIVRTLLSDLRVGVAAGVIRDAITEAFYPNEKADMVKRVQEAYDLSNDIAIVFDAAAKGKSALEEIEIEPGRPLNVMLAVKVESIEEAFEACGKPAALEYKYDGFRMIMTKKGKDIHLFTRKLEDVTNQFPDVVSALKDNVKGESYILDGEVVGFDPKTKKYRPFEAISQRIKRKYDIDRLIKELPVEINIFDVLYFNGKSWVKNQFKERRKLVEEIVGIKEMKIKPAVQIITGDENEAEAFYEGALRVGEEGIMIKKLDAPYQQGRKVGFMAKLKPIVNDLDLVIVGAEYGSGKRAGWLTSYIVACRGEGELLEVGKVSSGLKEKEGEEGTSYDEMTEMLKPLITGKEGNSVNVSPKIVVSVTYQNVQKSPSYNSGYALRFPRITHYRPDRTIKDIASIEDIEMESKGFGKRGGE